MVVGAVRPQKAQHFALLDLEVDSRHGGDGAEAFCQSLDFDHGPKWRRVKMNGLAH
jgi:hypothetical protein